MTLAALQRFVRNAAVITLTWVCVGAFFAWQHHTIIEARGTPDRFGARLAGMTASMIAWALLTPIVVSVANRLPVTRPFRARNALLVLLFAIAIGFLRALIDGWLPAVVHDMPLTFVDYRASVLGLFHTHVLFALLVIGVANFLRLEREDKTRRHAEARLEAELAEARLRQLRADLHPHFLFNALNAVAALLHRDRDAAATMLRKLRELLYASVATEHAREVRLSEELEFIERYLDIQKMRFGEKLTTTIQVREPRLKETAVPPLLLQPLVENSIVHGIARRRAGGAVAIVVQAERDAAGEWLRLEVEDNGPGSDPASILSRGSIGLPNALARLQSMYGEHQSLQYHRRGDQFVAAVRIPLRVMP